MFNLIMGGEPDYFEHWPMYERVSGSCDFPISRMLEGTSDDIRLKLTPLNDKALSYIEKLPTEGANKRGNSSRLTQSFHFFMFEPIFSPVNALNQPI